MSVEERDPYTGHRMTGHEWNGIKELNTPVPRAVYFFLIVTAAFSLVYWVLMPAWPLGVTYTKGLLGVDQRTAVADSLKQAAHDRAAWIKRIETESYSDIQKDPGLMRIVRQTGRTLFGDNCAACHGRDARGGNGFPNLTTTSWLWGGDPDAMAETIRVGVNSAHPKTRTSQMMAFGRDKVLPRGDIDNVVAYVRALSAAPTLVVASAGGEVDTADATAAKAAAGKAVFAATCAACHGPEGKGNTELGVPDLTDQNWTYGGDARSIYDSGWDGRQGQMPTWEARLSDVERKILVLYLTDLRSRKP